MADCPTCGSPVKVVGGETKHYRPLLEHRIRDEIVWLRSHGHCTRAELLETWIGEKP